MNSPRLNRYRLLTIVSTLLALSVTGCVEDKPAADSATLDVEQTLDMPLSVSMIKPNGVEQTEVTQIVIVFNKKMVPLGDMEKSAQGLPVSIAPAPGCHWRWLNTTTLGCWLDKELPYSTQYRVTVRAGMKALDGTTLGGDHVVDFATETLKKVCSAVEFTGPVNPVITVALNQPVDMASLKAAATMDCAGGTTVSALKVRKLNVEEEAGTWDAARSYRFEAPGVVEFGFEFDFIRFRFLAAGDIPNDADGMPFSPKLHRRAHNPEA